MLMMLEAEGTLYGDVKENVQAAAASPQDQVVPRGFKAHSLLKTGLIPFQSTPPPLPIPTELRTWAQLWHPMGGKGMGGKAGVRSAILLESAFCATAA